MYETTTHCEALVVLPLGIGAKLFNQHTGWLDLLTDEKRRVLVRVGSVGSVGRCARVGEKEASRCEQERWKEEKVSSVDLSSSAMFPTYRMSTCPYDAAAWRGVYVYGSGAVGDTPIAGKIKASESLPRGKIWEKTDSPCSSTSSLTRSMSPSPAAIQMFLPPSCSPFAGVVFVGTGMMVAQRKGMESRASKSVRSTISSHERGTLKLQGRKIKGRGA